MPAHDRSVLMPGFPVFPQQRITAKVEGVLPESSRGNRAWRYESQHFGSWWGERPREPARQ